MLSKQDAVLAALRRAQRFITENLAQLTSAVDLTVARKRLDDVIASLSTHALDQDANVRSAKGETENQRQLRLTLRKEQMKPIAEIARQDLTNVPQFSALRMPPRSFKGERFIASASAMAQAAATYKTALLERGLSADFLDRFQASLEKMQASVSDRSNNVSLRMGATKGLLYEERQGRNVLKVLDALVYRALNGNAALLGTWQGARTIYPRPKAGVTTSSTPATSSSTGAPAPAAQPSTPTPASSQPAAGGTAA